MLHCAPPAPLCSTCSTCCLFVLTFYTLYTLLIGFVHDNAFVCPVHCGQICLQGGWYCETGWHLYQVVCFFSIVSIVSQVTISVCILTTHDGIHVMTIQYLYIYTLYICPIVTYKVKFESGNYCLIKLYFGVVMKAIKNTKVMNDQFTICFVKTVMQSTYNEEIYYKRFNHE